MNNKKRNILIICIIAILIVVIGIAGILYFILTNTKSKKEVFAGKIIEFMSENQEENTLNEYFKKKETMPYENEGNISIQGSNINGNVQIPKIVFSGKSNPEQNQAEQNIEIQYSDEVKFPISYRQDNDIFGLQTKYLSSKYIAVENNNLQEFLGKLGMDTSQIQDKIEIPKIDNQNLFTEEEIKQLKDKYSVILENIKEEQITVTKEENGETYTLALEPQTIKDILVQFMDILKNDDLILGKINSLGTENNGQINESISELANNIKNINTEELKNVKIVIFSEDGKTRTLSFMLEDTEKQDHVVFDIAKTENEFMYNIYLEPSAYDIENENENGKITFSGKISGIAQEQDILESYKLGIINENDESIEIIFENTINFSNDVQIEKMTDENTMLLNNYSQEQLAVIMQAMTTRLTEVNKSQMEQLGVGEDENPFMTILAGAFANNSAKETITNTNIDTDVTDTTDTSDDMDEEENEWQEETNNMQNSMQQAEIQAFNSRFEKYKGTMKGTMVKSLLQDIQMSNASDMENQVKIEGVISSTMEANSIEGSQKYEISVLYDNMGRVNAVKIENSSN